MVRNHSPFEIYSGYELQIPDDEAASRWGYIDVEGKAIEANVD